MTHNRDELKEKITKTIRDRREYARSDEIAEACLSAIEQSGCTICDEVSCNRPETVEQSVSAQAPLQTDTAREAEGGGRTCTCHPDDRPPVCQREFATTHCRLAYAEKQLEEAKEIIRVLADIEPSSLVEPGSEDDRYTLYLSEKHQAHEIHGDDLRRARSFLNREKEDG